MDIKADDIQGIIQQPTLLIHSAWLEIQKATADESIYKQTKKYTTRPDSAKGNWILSLVEWQDY